MEFTRNDRKKARHVQLVTANGIAECVVIESLSRSQFNINKNKRVGHARTGRDAPATKSHYRNTIAKL